MACTQNNCGLSIKKRYNCVINRELQHIHVDVKFQVNTSIINQMNEDSFLFSVTEAVHWAIWKIKVKNKQTKISPQVQVKDTEHKQKQ